MNTTKKRIALVSFWCALAGVATWANQACNGLSPAQIDQKLSDLNNGSTTGDVSNGTGDSTGDGTDGTVKTPPPPDTAMDPGPTPLPPVASPPVPSDPNRPSTVDWTGGDWETGITGTGRYSSIQAAENYSFQRVTSPVRQGKYSARIELRYGDSPGSSGSSRAEVAHSILSNGKEWSPVEGTTDFYAFSVRLDTTWQAPTGWGIIMQLHSFTGSPPFAFRAMDKFGVMLNGGNTCSSNQFQEIKFSDGSLNAGRWVDFVMKIKWSSKNTGTLTVWRRNEGDTNFKVVADVSGVSQMKSCASGHYWKTGLYRDKVNHQTNILWLDGLNRGKNFDDVVAHAFGK